MDSFTKISVQRDIRNSEICFINDMPLKIQDRLDTDTYRSYIDKINLIFKPKVSLLSTFKILSLIFFLTEELDSYDGEVEEVLMKINEDVKDKGLFFVHPKFNNYIEMDLKIFEIKAVQQ
ncbi:hypothetical protein P3W45_000126 [Vairimorpha bombi]|jgi:hypothetical protein